MMRGIPESGTEVVAQAWRDTHHLAGKDQGQKAGRTERENAVGQDLGQILPFRNGN